jgi:hypothetical protein
VMSPQPEKIVPWVYGRAGSGKSTLIAALAMYCRHEQFYEEDPDNIGGIRLLDQWIQDLHLNGKFPEATPTTTFQQLNFGFRTRNEDCFHMHFLELAGENFRAFDAGSQITIPAPLREWRDRFDRLVVVLSHSASYDDVTAATRFLSAAQKLRPGVPCCLVRSKWDRVNGQGTAAIDKIFLPIERALSRLREEHGDFFPIINFSIGIVEDQGGSMNLRNFQSDKGVEQLLTWLVRPEEYL